MHAQDELGDYTGASASYLRVKAASRMRSRVVPRQAGARSGRRAAAEHARRAWQPGRHVRRQFPRAAGELNELLAEPMPADSAEDELWVKLRS